MKKEDFYEEISIQLQCETEDYLDFARFIQALETASYAMRVDNLDVSFTSATDNRSVRRRGVSAQEAKNVIASSVTVVVEGLGPGPSFFASPNFLHN